MSQPRGNRGNVGRVIARTLTLNACTQMAFAVYLTTSAFLNFREAWRVMNDE